MSTARYASSFLFATLTFVSAMGWSQATSTSLRDAALAETTAKGTAQKYASDAQTTGMLVLKDPKPEIVTRPWQYFAGFTAQQFQAKGTVTTETAGTFDLSQNDQTFMPGLTFGVMTPEWNVKNILISGGVRFDASMATQNSAVTLPSGATIDDARLNTTMASLGPVLNISHAKISWLAVTFTPQYGNLNYTQTSSNDFAHFSKQASYLALNYGLDFRLTKKWSVFTEWSQRELRDQNQEIALEKDNFELGTRVSW
ncbi:hypothetical protein ACLSU7_16495 [Bdellovibrio sp. HCB185ZH]|uniref:hypothetical protein n=1 Tax=Bdellovibrio sp. HCB185ZH TaxID=3394235 RepID=UPI0039A7442A